MLDRGFFDLHFLSNALYTPYIPHNIACPAWGVTVHFRPNAPLC